MTFFIIIDLFAFRLVISLIFMIDDDLVLGIVKYLEHIVIIAC